MKRKCHSWLGDRVGRREKDGKGSGVGSATPKKVERNKNILGLMIWMNFPFGLIAAMSVRANGSFDTSMNVNREANWWWCEWMRKRKGKTEENMWMNFLSWFLWRWYAVDSFNVSLYEGINFRMNNKAKQKKNERRSDGKVVADSQTWAESCRATKCAEIKFVFPKKSEQNFFHADAERCENEAWWRIINKLLRSG